MSDEYEIKGHTYLLPRNASELERLNEQHSYLTKNACDGRLVYKGDVMTKLQKAREGRILDIGTGTGIWLAELAHQVPTSVELHGVDLSSENYPRGDMLPRNVFLQIASVTDLPERWSNYFDLIHQRFLIVGLLASEWPKAVAEIFRVLKPGGAVQLLEREPTFVDAPPQSAMQRHDEIFEKMHQKKEINGDCARALPALLEQAGFVDISDDVKILPIGKKWGEEGEVGVGTFSGAYLNMGPVVVEEGLVESAAEYEALIGDLKEEWDREGAQVACHMICARKPLVRVKPQSGSNVINSFFGRCQL